MNPQEISVTDLADGRVYAAARNGHHTTKADACAIHNRAFVISSDGGAILTQRFAVEPDLTIPRGQGSVPEMSATTAGGAYARLLVAGPSTCDRCKKLRVRSSFDEGGMWSSDANSLLVLGQDASCPGLVSVSPKSVGPLYEAAVPSSRPTPASGGPRSARRSSAPGVRHRRRRIDSARLTTAGTAYLSYHRPMARTA
ncbi:sialidase family protein [Amycolatopsis sp. NPDC023774]|uniref:sialidase family protein n=1 Tax=Amycolatopsis sp. NPDC023774 TaxID=3155015 RepID=UPI0033E6D91E